MDDITPFGEVFLKADTIPAMQECFLRSLVVEQYWLPDNSAHYSPFRWILAIMLIMHEIISRGVCPICEKKVDLPEDYFKKVIKASEHAKQCFS